MNTEKFLYKVEINLYPNTADNDTDPYGWVIWEIDKNNPQSKTNAAWGWAKSAEEAFSQAQRHYYKYGEPNLTRASGIKEVWQPEYRMADGTVEVGDCYGTEEAALAHAAGVDMVQTNDGLKCVAGFGTRKCRYIPKR